VLGLACVGVVQGFIQDWERERDTRWAGACISNASELALAVLKYADDHGGRLPPARDWCDRVRPYVRDPKAFVCPAARNQRCSYAFNARLSEVHRDSIKEPLVVFVFESDRGWNAAGGPELLPAKPRHSFGRTDVFTRGDGSLLHTSTNCREVVTGPRSWQPWPQAAGKGSR